MTYFQDYSKEIGAIRKAQLAPIYLLIGSEHLLYQKFQETLVAEFRKLHGSQGEVHQRWGSDLKDLADIRVLLGGGGLFSSATLLLIHGLEDAGVSVKKDLAKAIQDLSPGTYVSMGYAGDRRRKAWLETVKRASKVIMVETPFPNETGRILERLADLRGLTLTAGAIERLLQFTGGDLAIIDQELEKISLFFNGAENRIDARHVDQVSGMIDSAGPDTLVKAILNRDRSSAIQALQEIVRQGQEGLPYLVAVIQTNLVRVRLAQSSGGQKDIRLPPMPAQARRMVAQARSRFKPEEIDDALIRLARMDLEFRLGGADMLSAFTQWIAEVLK